jgi:antitoxin (DNA-binding transcriptional repressor) of toxin-antitoxin stability system
MTMVTVTEFKAKCLGIISQVQKEKRAISITKNGRIAAHLVPSLHQQPGQLFGRAKKSTKVLGDLLSTGETWDAED